MNLSSIGKAVGVFFLTVFLIAFIFILGLSQITDYQYIKPAFAEIIENQLESQLSPEKLDQLSMLIKQECTKTDVYTLPFSDFNLQLNCKEIPPSSQLSSFISEKVFDSYYFKNYSCSGFDCMKNMFSGNPQDMAVILSAKMNEFFKSLLFYIALGIAASIAIIVLSIRKVFSILKTIGFAMIVTGIGFIFIMISKFLLPNASIASGIIEKVTSIFELLYGAVLAIGIVFVIIGYIGIKYYENKEVKTSKPRNTRKR